MNLSVIVPAYREAQNIVRNVKFFGEILKTEGYDFEIIVVVDGCKETYEAAKKINDERVRVLFYERNQGKGFALKYGALFAKKDFIAFLDADAENDPSSLITFLHLLQDFEADIVVGSKRHPLSKVHYPWSRRLMSWIYQCLNRFLFGLKVRDTQVGLKVFRRAVLEQVLPRVLVKRFAFDLELLAVANHLGFTRIWEAPINLKHNFSGSTVNFKEVLQIIQDTLAIFYRLRIIHYYDRLEIKSAVIRGDQRVSEV